MVMDITYGHYKVGSWERFWLYTCLLQTVLKPHSQCIVLVNSENKKMFPIGFVYRVLWVLKALLIVLSKTIYVLRNLQPPPPPKKKGYIHSFL